MVACLAPCFSTGTARYSAQRPLTLTVAPPPSRQALPGVPIMALTATAPPESVASISRSLGMTNVLLLRGSLKRSNMRYSTMPMGVGGGKRSMLCAVVQRLSLGGQSGIIFTSSRRRTERLRDALRDVLDERVQVEAYHAGLEDDAREGLEVHWSLGHTKVMVSTNAFGMGMDKPDVRWVVHDGLPRSVAAMYQESARAGRDGHGAEHVLSSNLGEWISAIEWRASDFATQPAAQNWAVGNLLDMLAYLLDSTTCRHVILNSYLGEGAERECDAADRARWCDNCCRRRGERLWWRGDEVPVAEGVKRDQWVPSLLAVVRAAQTARTQARGSAAGPPSLRRVAVDWLCARGEELPHAWARAPLLALALKHGVLRLGFEQLRQVGKDDARGRSRWHAVVSLDASSLAVATDSPALAFVALHRSGFDPGGNDVGSAEAADLEAADEARREERPEALERAAERAAAVEREALADAASAEESDVQEECGEEAQADVVAGDCGAAPFG